MAFADKYRKGNSVSLGSQYRKSAQGIAPIKRQPIVLKRTPIQETERYKQALGNAERASEVAKKAGSFLTITKETGKGVAKALAEYIPKTAVSIAETPGTLIRGTAKQKTYNLPVIGKFKSYQSEAEDTANEIIEGRKPLYSSLKPFVEVPLNLLPFGRRLAPTNKTGILIPSEWNNSSLRSPSVGMGQATVPRARTIPTSQPITQSLPGGIQQPASSPVSFGASYRRNSISSVSPQILSTPRKVVTSGETILKKSGEGGQKMVELMRKQLLDEDLMRGDMTVKLKTATQGLKKPELENLTDVLEGKATPLSDGVAKAAKEVRSLYDDIAKEAQRQQFEVRVPGGGSVPFKPRENYAPRIYNFDEITKAGRREEMLQHLVDSGQARNKAEAAKLFDDFISANAQRRAGNLENARMLDLPGYEKNALKAGESYVSNVAKRFTEAQNFGKKDENIAEFVNQIANEGGDYQEAQRIFDMIAQGVPKNKITSAVTQFNLATKLDLGAISNLSQSLNTMTKGGIKNTIKAIVNRGERQKLGELAGVYDDLVIVNETGVNPAKFVRGIMYIFGKVEKFNRSVAALTGKYRAQELVKVASKNPNATYALRQLDTLGIDPQKALTGKLTERDLLVAANKMSELTQFKPNALNIPPAWKTPLGRVLTQFKSFSFMQTKFIRDEILKEAGKGNLAPMMRFLALVPMFSYATQATRNLVTGRDPEDEKMALDVRSLDRYTRAGGSFFTEPIVQGKFLKDTYQNKYATPLKQVTRTLSTFGGPTAGEIGNTLVSLEDAANREERNRTWYKDHEAAQEDPYLMLKRQAVGSIPFAGEILKNKFFGFEDTVAEQAKEKAIQAIQTGNVDLLIEAQQTDPYLRRQGAFQALLREAGKSAAKLNQQKQYQGFYDPTPKKKTETSSFYTR